MLVENFQLSLYKLVHNTVFFLTLRSKRTFSVKSLKMHRTKESFEDINGIKNLALLTLAKLSVAISIFSIQSNGSICSREGHVDDTLTVAVAVVFYMDKKNEKIE